MSPRDLVPFLPRDKGWRRGRVRSSCRLNRRAASAALTPSNLDVPRGRVQLYVTTKQIKRTLNLKRTVLARGRAAFRNRMRCTATVGPAR